MALKAARGSRSNTNARDASVYRDFVRGADKMAPGLDIWPAVVL